MNYLVTGGAGFIGSHIVESLLKRGDKVRVLDNFISGLRENIPDGVEVIEADIKDLDAIRPAFHGINGVFHIAAYPNVQFSIENPLESNAVNLTGTLNVIIAAKEAGVKRIVFAASSAAYGDQEKLPVTEDMPALPLSPYGLQKYVSEHYLRLANLLWNLQTVSLRFFNVYGPRMSFSGAYYTVIAVFLKQRADGKPMTITGDGTQTRDFTFVEDVAAANLLAMDSQQVGKGEVINIGSGENHSVNEIAALLGGEAIHVAPRIEPHDTLADISRAKALLNWEPQIKFSEGIKKTLEWFSTYK